VRCYASLAYAVMQCLSDHLSCLWILSKQIFKICSPLGSHTILVFPHQTFWQYCDLNTPNGGIECRWGRRFSGNIWLRCVLWTVWLPSVIHSAATDRGKLLTLVVGKRQHLFLTGDDDEVFMTRSLNVTPKTTEQHLIVRSGKSEAELTNNNRLHCLS